MWECVTQCKPRFKKKKEGGKSKAAPAVVVYNSVPRVGSSRGAERDPHLSSRTSKGSCTFRAREERRRAGRGSRIFPGNVRPGGGPTSRRFPAGFYRGSHPPNQAKRFPHRGERLYRPRPRCPGHHPSCCFSPLPAGPGRERGFGVGGNGTCRLLGLVVRGPLAASPPARPGTTGPTWPCAPAHELLGALAHLLYCLAEDKKKSNWRDYKANVAGAAGAK